LPRVDPLSRAVAGAVVFLRGVDPKRARPWNHGPVTIEFRGRTLAVLQDESSNIGFVQRGSDIQVINRDAEYHALRARGADFFALPLPDPKIPSGRTMAQSGIVELTSAAGFAWMRAYLFVDDHPYYAQTDADGRFKLEQVPSGQYELVCWLPSWVVAGRERDPDSSYVTRLNVAPPQEQTRTLRVDSGSLPPVEFTWTRRAFEGQASDDKNAQR
jgi:hypothetical protein